MAAFCFSKTMSNTSSGFAVAASAFAKLRIVPFDRLCRRYPLRLTLIACILNNNPHAVFAVVIGKIAHDPDSRMVHFDNGGDALRRSQPEAGNPNRIGKQIAVHCDNRESVSRKCEAPNLACASIQYMEEDLLSLLYTNWFAVPKHLSIDREGVVANLVSVRRFLSQAKHSSNLASILQRRNGLCRRQKIHRHISAPAEGRLELFHGEKDFAVVAPWVFLRLNIDWPNESAVLSCRKIGSGSNVRMVEAKTGRPRNKGDASAAMRSDKGRPFLRSAIYIRTDKLPMPVQLLRYVRLILYIDRNPLPFLHPEQRTRKLAVVGHYRNDSIWGKFKRRGCNLQCVIRFRVQSWISQPIDRRAVVDCATKTSLQEPLRFGENPGEKLQTVS